MADVAYTQLAASEAARLDDLRIDCLEDRLDAELALGRHEAALSELELLSAEHPLRERARQRLALALYRSERQVDALRVLADGRRRLRDELGLDPSAEHDRLEHAILEHSPDLRVVARVDAPLATLPVPVTPLVGRRDEIERIAALLERDDVRLLTITGAGGSGKTRVALELARSLGHRFANGAVFVELAPLRDPRLVLSTIARQLGMVESAEPTVVGLARRLRNLELLVVVDNVEHLIDAAPDLAGLLRDTERLTMLATSRRVLHVGGEHVYSLEPLPDEDAVRLFTDRMAAAGRSGSDDDADGVIGAICRRVDGLPLAVELAAARTTTMSPALLLARLGDRVTVLGVGPRDAPARQRTLADTVAWSTELLSGDEFRAFARLSVFAGGSTLDAAEMVAATGTDTIEALVDSSLLRRVTTNGTERLTMLETIREYAAACLDPADRAAAEAAHAAYYLSLSDRLTYDGSTAIEVLARLDAEMDNVRAAFDRSIAGGDDDTALALAVSVDRYWDVRGYYREGCDRIGLLLERGAGPPALRARAVAMMSLLTYRLGELGDAVILATRGVELATATRSLAAAYECHNVLGIIALDRNDLTTARRYLERAHTIAADLDRDETRAHANGNLADLAMTSGDNVLARQLWERNLGSTLPPWVELHTRWGLGTVARREGRHDAANDQFTRAAGVGGKSRLPALRRRRPSRPGRGRSRPGERRPRAIPAQTRRRRPRGRRNRAHRHRRRRLPRRPQSCARRA